jgi:hypothetical protein
LQRCGGTKRERQSYLCKKLWRSVCQAKKCRKPSQRYWVM